MKLFGQWVAWLGDRARLVCALLLGLSLLATVSSACSSQNARSPGDASSANLLANARILRADGVRHPERLVDGVMPVEGDVWQSNLTTILISTKSAVVFDLGETRTIVAATLQGDNNDVYTLQISDDGQNFRLLWSASQTQEPGLRTRAISGLNVRGRYVKVTAGSGDTSFSLGEVAVFAEKPGVFPPELPTVEGVKADEAMRTKMMLFGAALIVFVLFTGRGLPLWWNLLLVMLPLYGCWELWRGFDNAWPPGQREISLLRAITGVVGTIVVLREAVLPLGLRWLYGKFWAKRGPPPNLAGQPLSSVIALAIAGCLGLATFANLGHPQFWDHKLQEPSRVHNFDMRVYYPVAKYFKELQYDGLYQASVMAYVDDTPGLTLDAVDHVTIRDLKTHHMTRVRDVEEEIRAVKQRFSPERWKEFLVDMRYFRETMGLRDYLGSMHDHGGNATPVWMALAHVLFARTTATNEVLWAGALLDPLLLIAAFLAVWRVFGVRTMLLSMLVFGANDYYMFGSNWFGATLRHDWMTLLVFGACALKRERWALGGALLAWSALIRAFPALALAAVLVPAVWWASEQRKKTGHFPSWKSWREAQGPVLRIMAGAAVCVAVWFTVSTAMLGLDAWIQWANKAKLLATGPHVNHVSLRALVAYDPRYTFEALQANPPPDTADWSIWQDRVFRARGILYAALVVAYVSMVAVLASRRRLEQAVVLGLFLIPVVFYPANYYAHFVYLLPLLAVERSWKEKAERPVSLDGAIVWIAVTAMCAVQYWSVLAKELDTHFNSASLILMVTLTVILVTLLLEDHYRFSERVELWATSPLLAGVAKSAARPAGDGKRPAKSSRGGKGRSGTKKRRPASEQAASTSTAPADRTAKAGEKDSPAPAQAGKGDTESQPSTARTEAEAEAAPPAAAEAEDGVSGDEG